MTVDYEVLRPGLQVETRVGGGRAVVELEFGTSLPADVAPTTVERLLHRGVIRPRRPPVAPAPPPPEVAAARAAWDAFARAVHHTPEAALGLYTVYRTARALALAAAQAGPPRERLPIPPWPGDRRDLWSEYHRLAGIRDQDYPADAEAEAAYAEATATWHDQVTAYAQWWHGLAAPRPEADQHGLRPPTPGVARVAEPQPRYIPPPLPQLPPADDYGRAVDLALSQPAPPAAPPAAGGAAAVAERRKAVADLTEQGLSARQVADRLGVDHSTVTRDRAALGGA